MNGQKKRRRRKKNLNLSRQHFFLYSEQNRSTYIESDKKQKKKANIRLHTTPSRK
jgi:hypothetical protein